jgi:hypothetical protein
VSARDRVEGEAKTAADPKRNCRRERPGGNEKVTKYSEMIGEFKLKQSL